MKSTITVLCLLAFLGSIVAPPVAPSAKQNKSVPNANNDDSSDDVLSQLEYGRYLKEVVDILENDKEFKKKIENASLDEIKSGNIAEHLSLVQHHVRTQLDEAKQREIARLRQLVARKFRTLTEKQRLALARADPDGKRIRELLPQHIDHNNADTFSQKDLERLIRHASNDLDEIDRRRQKEFKEYELRKEYQRRAKLAKLNAQERDRLERLHQEALAKKKRHRKVNHPGSVDQMEEVWEQVDRLEAEQFSPRSFFKLHDINGDGFLDEAELEAIMLKEAEKIHDETPEADPVEKQEEMNRMRQHVMREFDKNQDRMVSIEEFIRGVNASEAKNDQGWKSIEDQPVFSDQEFQTFSSQMAPRSTPIPPHQTPSPSLPTQPQAQGGAPVQQQQQREPGVPAEQPAQVQAPQAH